MDFKARQRANIPRPGRFQPVTGLDPYHRLLRETHDLPSLPYTADQNSFSVPRSPRRTSSIPSRSITPASSQLLTTTGTTATPAPTTTTQRSTPEVSEAGSRPDDAPSPVIDSEALATSVASWRKNGIYGHRLRWRPEYLRRRVLLGFGFAFAVLAAAVEVALYFSGVKGGLANADELVRLLWQYGVTLLFVIVAAVWLRVEFQAKSVAPWMRMASGAVSADSSILLDYISMDRFKAAIVSFRNGDVLVTGSAGISIVLLLVIVLAPAITAPNAARVPRDDGRVTVTADFMNDAGGLLGISSLPYLTMLRMQTTNIGPPDGVTDRFAHQTFRATFTPTTQVTAVVNGFEAEMECQAAPVRLEAFGTVGNSIMSVGLALLAEDCETQQVVNVTAVPDEETGVVNSLLLAMQPGSCGGSEDDADQRIVIVSGTVVSSLNSVNLLSATGLVCQPSFTLSTVKVVRNSTDLISAEKTTPPIVFSLPAVTPSDVIRAHFDSYRRSTLGPEFAQRVVPLYQDQTALDIDEPMAAAVLMRTKASGSPPSLDTLQQPDDLQDLVREYYRQYMAIVAVNSLMEPVEISMPAGVTVLAQRLVVREVVAHIVTSLLGLCFVTSLVMLYFTPKRPLLPRSPDSVWAMATILYQSDSLLRSLRGMGGAGSEEMRRKLMGMTYSTGFQDEYGSKSPTSGVFCIMGSTFLPRDSMIRVNTTSAWAQPIFALGLVKLLFIFTFAALIVGLEVTFRGSERGTGLARLTESVDSYLYLLWTMLPVILMLPIALYLETLDSYVRSLAPFSALLEGSSFGRSMGLRILDCTRAVGLWRALRVRDAPTALTSLMALVSLLLAVASAGLYAATLSQVSFNVIVGTRDAFSSGVSAISSRQCDDCWRDTMNAPLGESRYPPFTYEDLAFPPISSLNIGQLSDEQSLAVVVPAVRPHMKCRSYNAEDMSLRATRGNSTDGGSHTLQYRIDACGTDRDGQSQSVQFEPGVDTVFGRGTSRRDNEGQCSGWLYVWGKLPDSDSDEASLGSFRALACNETMEKVETRVVYQGASLRIDVSDVPIPVEETAEAIRLDLPPLDYDSLMSNIGWRTVDSFFMRLASSRLAGDQRVLGEAEGTVDISQAVLRQHNIMRMQALYISTRQPGASIAAASNSSDSAVAAAAQVETSTLTGIVTGTRVNLRQGLIATRILQGILGLLLVLLLVSWLVTKEILLPQRPTSIGAVAAWLADGDIPHYLDTDTKLSASEKQARFFRLSWEVDALTGMAPQTGKASFGIRWLKM
ncbi:hypothetical protein B0I35DRAFT_476807 [Stachybotrys elegans]|uniref:Uncharacterized protein n=1 Tax=Stachybotrys elegans TaxID=80388 RepID=A0A8K0WU87_9HYPO|nr:hypothetical protein B0I35DRAFT_476807 [Stachybotrys elegans]